MRTEEQIREEIYQERHAIFQHEQRIRELQEELSATKTDSTIEASKLREELKTFME